MNNESVLSRRPTVAFTEDEYRIVRDHCALNRISMQDFLRKAAEYCIIYGIEFEK